MDQIITISTEWNDDFSEDRAVAIVHKTFEEFLEKNIHYIIYNQSILNKLFQNKDFVQAMDRAGFRNLESLKEIEEKVVAEKRYFVTDYGGRPNEVNDKYVCKNYTPNMLVLQSVKWDSLKDINPDLYKVLEKGRKAYVKNEKEKVARKEKNKDKKKQREIERAKKILEEAGELKS